MPNEESRILENTRVFQGEKAAEVLVNWLNFTEDVSAVNRILEIVRTFVERCSLGVSLPETDFFERDDKVYMVESELTQHRSELDKKLQELLSYYTVVPSVTFPTHAGFAPGPVPYVIYWRAAPGSPLDTEQLHFDETREWRDEFELSGVQMSESGAIRVALDLLSSGLMWKIRRCRCSKFHFQRFSHQRFCSSACRLADSRDSDDARKKRNEYARKLYQLKKSGKVK